MAGLPSGLSLTPPQGKDMDQQRNLLNTATDLLPLNSLGFFFSFWDGVEMSPLLLRQFIGLLYQPRMMVMDDNCGEMGGMVGRGYRSTRRKPDTVLLSPPQIPHDMTRAPTQAATACSQGLTACAAARPHR
jgi:hypothetical protein